MSDDLVKRLRLRAESDRAIQANNEVIAAALRGQRLLFDQGIRSPSNTFAVRMALDHERCAKNDAILAQTWDEAAARIEELEAKLAKAVVAIDFAYNTLHEINTSNYDHDDVCMLNDRSVEVILYLASTIADLKGGDV